MRLWEYLKESKAVTKLRGTRGFEGEWLVDTIKCHHAKVFSAGKPNAVRNGWELRNTIVFLDYRYRLWVCEPGYVWDGPSYPSTDSILGKILKYTIGNRKKEGLLAASAMHDSMLPESFVYQTTLMAVNDVREAIEANMITEYLAEMTKVSIKMGIPEAAMIYADMINHWPDRKETIGRYRSSKQFFGLLLFHPLCRAIARGTHGGAWEKADKD